jgi:hypothetical protein
MLLTEDVILRIMREEWDRKVDSLRQEVLSLSKDVDDDGKPETLISPELKLRHKKSGLRYTVDSVGPRSVVIRTPEEEPITLDGETLEREYEIA